MPDKSTSLHTIGLVLSHQTLQGAVLAFQKGKPCLIEAFEMPLQQGASSSPEVLSPDDAAKLQSYAQRNLTVTCLGGEEALIRPLEIKLKKEKDIDAVLAFQAEPLLPYPIDNAVIDKIKISEGQEGSLLTVAAVRKDHLQQHLDLWHRFEVEPEIVSCASAALAAFSLHFSSGEKSRLVLHIGQTQILCILTHQGKLQAGLSIDSGTLHLAQALDQDLQQPSIQEPATLRSLNFLEVDKEHYPALSSALESLRLEVVRTLYALLKQAKGEEISSVLLTGEGAAFNNLAEALCHTVKKSLQAPAVDPLFNLKPAELQKFALPIGAALTALPHYKHQVNFRQGEFAYPHPWRRYKKPLAVYFSLCFLLALAFYVMTQGYIKYREDQVRQSYSELLQFMHKPYTGFEKEFQKPQEPQDIASIRQLSSNDLIKRLQFLDKELQSSPYYYPLMPNTPTVSDVFAWLSTHPNVVAIDPKIGSVKPLLVLENFNYTMIKKPDQTRKQEKYQVKVEIEFSSPTPKLAREFHDALIAPNAFVDPKGEVKWNTNRGLYRASFFLKDKTVYPSS